MGLAKAIIAGPKLDIGTDINFGNCFDNLIKDGERVDVRIAYVRVFT